MNNHSHNRLSSHQTSPNLIQRVSALSEAGRHKEAFHLLDGENTALPEIRNARGVCLMRMERHREALSLFRALVIPLSCTWMRPELPVIYRANLVTALMLAKLPQGAQNALQEIKEQDHPSVIRLRDAMHHWASQLSWGRWLHWKSGLDMTDEIPLHFPAGNFFDPSMVDLLRTQVHENQLLTSA
ncbi:hypothetical protein Pla110_01570 [Polystyrenella longa]|uniref:Tetratricopeptide repeat protein n=1 Tax=Polystyrenella longa TaxID=2528007 RepID=A0A518CGV4_9PLAN|nr:hypothetical protein [Polystyrenella longa]QDU78453.1 hypothetical protein Pla110_01570 [Polystyrenella longa]